MNCQSFISFLADYLDQGLPPDVTAGFEQHLAVCASCTAYLATYRETIRMARASASASELALSEAPEELIAAVLAATRE
jgi:anti-sigma factor RsiW